MSKNKPNPQPKTLPAHVGIAVCSIIVDASGDSAMQLFPAGTFNAPRGALHGKGPWQLNADSAKRLIGVVAQRQNDIVIDYEHQSLLVAKNGQPVIAAGWIGTQSLEWRDPPVAHPGLYAINPKWTAAASAHIAADEIRYVSPVFSYDAKTGEVLDILNVALTNNPAIDGMQAVTLAAASLLAATDLPNPTESAMEIEELLERLRYLFNLPTLATIDEIAAELDKAKALINTNTADAAATSLLDILAAKDNKIAALTAQAGTAPDLSQFAPIAVVRELQQQVAALTSGTVENRVEKLIEAGKADGRIIGDAMETYLTDMGKQNIAALTAYLDAAQPIAALSGMQTGGKPPVSDEQVAALSITDEDRAVASQLGLDESVFIKQRSQ